MQNGKHPPKLHYGRLVQSEHAYRPMVARIPAGLNIKDVEHPEFWAHYARDLKALDTIECICDDGLWEALFRVMFVSKVEVKLSLIYKAVHETVDAFDCETHYVKYISPSVRYGVFTKNTNEKVKDNLETPSAAYAFLKQHLQDLQR